MKRSIIALTTLAFATGVAVAFSLITGTEFRPGPPSRPLAEAYAIALQALGSVTNEYYCVSARISRDWCYAGEWVFIFDKNKMQHKEVFVAMKTYDNFNPALHLKPWPLTEVRNTGVILNSTNSDPSKARQTFDWTR